MKKKNWEANKKVHIPKLFGKASLLSYVMAAAVLFLSGVLIKSAVEQFIKGAWFSACVSILGVVLTIIAGSIIIVDLAKKKKGK